MSRAFRAKYPGRCPACPDDIEIDDLLTYDADDRVIHADCAATDPTAGLRKPPVICPGCFMTKAENGACDCDD